MADHPTISLVTLKSSLFDAGIDIEKADRGFTTKLYALLSRPWLSLEFSRYWTDTKQSFAYSYTFGSQVCHHFAQGCAVFAGLCYDSTPDRPKDAACCFGEMWYTTDAGVPHAINFAFVWENEKPVFVAFEPQASQIIQLSEKERNSCVFVRV